jgi:hypothetical protein
MMKLQLAKKKGDISTVLRSSEDTDAMQITEMSEDSLGSAHAGEIDRTSTLDVRDQFAGNNSFALPAEPNMMGMLQAELGAGHGGTGPVENDDDNETVGEFWTMAIHEAGAVRVERVNLLSDEPVDTRSTPRSATPPRGPGKSPVPGQPSRPGSSPIPGLDDLKIDNGGTLEEAATGLLEMFN